MTRKDDEVFYSEISLKVFIPSGKNVGPQAEKVVSAYEEVVDNFMEAVQETLEMIQKERACYDSVRGRCGLPDDARIEVDY